MEPAASGMKILQEALDQHGAVHAQDRTHDDAGDKQVEEVRLLGEIRHRLHDDRGKVTLKHQVGTG